MDQYKEKCQHLLKADAMGLSTCFQFAGILWDLLLLKIGNSVAGTWKSVTGQTAFTRTSIIYHFLGLHPGKSAFTCPLGRRVGLYQEAGNKRALQRPQGTYQRELGLCSLLASKLMLLIANGSYSLTIKSYLLIQAGLAAVLLGSRWVPGMAAPRK